MFGSFKFFSRENLTMKEERRKFLAASIFTPSQGEERESDVEKSHVGKIGKTAAI